MKSAALLINLGSPESYEVKDVRKYLDEFLMDSHVIDMPYLSRVLLVRGIILNTRPKRSAAAYRSVWWKEGSPLIVISERLQKKVQSYTTRPVYLAMRYARPSINEVLEKIKADMPQLEKLYVIPLYPHFAMSSYETVTDKVKELAARHLPSVELHFKEPFYNDPAYIDILAASIKDQLPEDHHLLFSYHGLPVRHLKKSDPTKSHCYASKDCCNRPSVAHNTCYKHQVLQTTKLVAEKLGLNEGSFSTSFQSRLGRDEWIIPYTAKVFVEYPRKGINKLAIVCPAFVSDCLETLEEVDVEGRQEFLHSGGESFAFIPCLNDSEAWSKLLAGWIDEACA